MNEFNEDASERFYQERWGGLISQFDIETDGASVSFQIRKKSDPDESAYCKLTVLEQTKMRPAGYAKGFWMDKDGKRVFYAEDIRNEGRSGKSPAENRKEYFPHVIGNAIASLIKRGACDMWRSSENTSENAKRMYREFLPSCPGIQVSCPDGIHFEVARIP